MFRIIEDEVLNTYYIHKKFLWFWIKWSFYKSNLVHDIQNVRFVIKNGRYDFSSGEKGDFYHLLDELNENDENGENIHGVKMHYVKNLEDFNNQFAEYLI